MLPLTHVNFQTIELHRDDSFSLLYLFFFCFRHSITNFSFSVSNRFYHFKKGEKMFFFFFSGIVKKAIVCFLGVWRKETSTCSFLEATAGCQKFEKRKKFKWKKKFFLSFFQKGTFNCFVFFSLIFFRHELNLWRNINNWESSGERTSCRDNNKQLTEVAAAELWGTA